jgi:DMSO/TMAO reductase YedYZ molybdopterin-dependent catalytic subunit
MPEDDGMGAITGQERNGPRASDPSAGGAGPRPPSADAGRRNRAAFVAGLAASAAAMALSAIVSAVAQTVPFLPVAIAQVLVRITSGGVDSFFIDRLGHWASRLAVAGICLAFFLAGGILFRAAFAGHEQRRGGGPALRSSLLAMAPLWFASVLLYPVAPQYAGRWAFAIVAAGIYAAAGATGALAYRRMTESAATRNPTSDPSRRYLLASMGVGAVAAAAGVLDLTRFVRSEPDPSTTRLTLPNLQRAVRPAPQPGDAAFASISGLTPEVTPASRFYVVNEELISPRIDGGSWRLQVGGLVDRPTSLSFDALTRLPAVERYQTLECISNEVGGPYISNGLFAGIPLREILTRAGVRHGAVQVVFVTVSGYADSIAIGEAMDPSTLVILGLNGRPLPVEHGYPARILAVGTYGMKNPKWLTQIQVVNRPYQGFWERRGWSKQATVRTNSRIDVPTSGTHATAVRTVAGIAFAGDRGISKVEVSFDGGSSWHAATLKTALSPYTWRLWRFEPDASLLSGSRSVMVRAYDGTGAMQPAQPQDPFPNGSAGYHTVALKA